MARTDRRSGGVIGGRTDNIGAGAGGGFGGNWRFLGFGGVVKGMFWVNGRGLGGV